MILRCEFPSHIQRKSQTTLPGKVFREIYVSRAIAVKGMRIINQLATLGFRLAESLGDVVSGRGGILMGITWGH